MSYLPDDEDGCEARALASGTQVVIPGTAGGSTSVKSFSVQNDEPHDMIVQLGATCRLRTELITGGNRSDMEGYFEASVDVGSMFGCDRSYVEVHLSGTGGVTGATQGHPAGEGILLGAELVSWFEVPSGASRVIDVRYHASADAENLRTGGGLGYVQFLFGSLLLHQKRGQALDATVTE